MAEHETAKSATTDGLTISPALDLVTEATQVPAEVSLIDRRTLVICGLAALLGIAAGFVARMLEGLIVLVTNLAFFGRLSLAHAVPADAVDNLGWFVVVIPIVGAIIVGLMARYGSQAIRGHGIPEAMEQVLTNESRIAPRITFLKPLSSAIAIGTGGPFGAEGPIIATGGAMGSVLGQILRTTVTERKVLLAAGAAAGMAATFGTPVSAVLLAIELLLFEFRPRSIIPVALAASAATGLRMAFKGAAAAFAMPNLHHPGGMALAFYIALGAFMGLAAVGVTRAVYAIEDTFDRLPIHWMWWPAIGAVAVGVVGYFAPDTLGVGYYNISNILSAKLTVGGLAFLCAMKFISWSIALGSGTSGGTLAPLFTIGGALGAVVGSGVAAIAPGLGVDVRVAGLVGMAAIFAGASRAMLASAVFAFETTLQPMGLLPLLAGCSAAYLVSSLMMRNSIMTEKIARRGVSTPGEYEADSLEQVRVSDIMTHQPITLNANDEVGKIREWLTSRTDEASHQGFPVLDERNVLIGVITQRDVRNSAAKDQQKIIELVRKLPKFVYEDCSVRQAADHMVNHDIGRLPVIARQNPTLLIGIVTRSDILSAYRRRVKEGKMQEPSLNWQKMWPARRK
jgi:CIC family chloride channel protein